jgi:predicted Zn-dependent protease
MKKINLYAMILSVLLSTGIHGQTAPAADTSAPAWYAEALSLYNQKKYNESLEKVRAVFEEFSGSYYLRMLAAANHLGLGNFDGALAHLRAAEKLFPERFEIQMMNASVFRAAGKPNQAISSLQKALSLNGPAQKIRLEEARIYYENSQFAKARTETEALLAADAKNSEAIYIDALIFARQSKWESAEFRFRQLLQMGGLPAVYSADLYNNLGYTLENISIQNRKAGNAEEANRYKTEAVSFYKKTLQTDAGHLSAKANLERINASSD